MTEEASMCIASCWALESSQELLWEGLVTLKIILQFNKMYLSISSKDAASMCHYSIRWSIQCWSSSSVPELIELHHFSNNTNPNSNLVVLKLHVWQSMPWEQHSAAVSPQTPWAEWSRVWFESFGSSKSSEWSKYPRSFLQAKRKKGENGSNDLHISKSVS